MNKMKEESDLWHYYVRQAILTPFVRNVPLLLLLFICVFSNSTTTPKPPALSSSAASARRRWEIFASCSFFVHLHREVPNHARSEGSKCNPSKYNGANPHEQAPTDGLTSTWFSDPWVFKNTSFSPHYYFYLLRLLYIGLYFIRSIRSLVIIKRWWVETGLYQCKLLLGLTVKKWGSWWFGKILNVQVKI